MVFCIFDQQFASDEIRHFPRSPIVRNYGIIHFGCDDYRIDQFFSLLSHSFTDFDCGRNTADDCSLVPWNFKCFTRKNKTRSGDRNFFSKMVCRIVNKSIPHSDFTVDSVLGVNDVNQADFSYFPSVVTDVLNIQTENSIEGVSVFEMTGQQAMRVKTLQNGQLDMSSLAAGVYMVQVQLEGKAVKSFKVIKN